MLQFKLNISKTVASIRQFGAVLPERMRPAVRNTARIFLDRVIDKTPAPPTPAGQVYTRTGRLHEGWQGAANELGMGVPSILMPPPRANYYGSPPRGQDLSGASFEERVTRNEVSFLMRNNVPYAFFVEVAGPGFPPRGGVFMVTRSSFETEADFIRQVQDTWAGIS